MKTFEKYFKEVEDLDYDPKELKLGIKVEHEHTKNSKIAEIIAKHHLSCNPKYYSELKKSGID